MTEGEKIKILEFMLHTLLTKGNAVAYSKKKPSVEQIGSLRHALNNASSVLSAPLLR